MTMEKDRIDNLWPISLGQFYNKDHSNNKKELLDFFKNYQLENPKSRRADENSNLYESSYDLHLKQNPSFSKLLGFIGSCVVKMSNFSNGVTNEDKRIFDVSVQSSWFINYEKNKGYVLPHQHGFCSWCCVYYVEIGDDASVENGSTYFLNPRAHRDSLDFGSLYRENNSRFYIPKEGLVLIWPNYLLHGSMPYSGLRNRIIVSANFTVNEVK